MKLEALRDLGLKLPFDDDIDPSASSTSLNGSSTHFVGDPIDLLKPIQSELLEYVHSCQDSLSSLSLAVNDSAIDKTFDQVYTKGKLLGEGGFALVFQCQHKTNGKSYAVKEVQKLTDDEGVVVKEDIREEIVCLKQLRDYPHFVRLLDVFDEPDHLCTYLIMEQMMGGDLLDKLAEIEVYPEEAARKVSRTLLEAVLFCHKRKIAHRDIKPENILLVRNDDISQIKLADFGCAKRWKRPNEMVTLCGSPQYVAPEVVGEQRKEGEGYNCQCDLWSCGVVIYIVLGGYAPFESEDEMELLELICNAEYEFDEEYWDDVSEPPKQLITQLLVINPKKRLSAKQALNCSWLRRRDGDWIKEQRQHQQSLEDSSSHHSSTFGAWLERRRSNVLSSSGGMQSPNPASPRRRSAHTPKDGTGEEFSERTETEEVTSGYNWNEADGSTGSFAEGPVSPSSSSDDKAPVGFSLKVSTEWTMRE